MPIMSEVRVNICVLPLFVCVHERRDRRRVVCIHCHCLCLCLNRRDRIDGEHVASKQWHGKWSFLTTDYEEVIIVQLV